MSKTKIEWVKNADGSAGDTWNPIRARNKATGSVGHFCVHVSPGCVNCYAERLQPRFNNPVRFAAQDSGKVEIFLDEKVLMQPLRWHKPRMIFVCSMTDLFAEWVPDEWIDRVNAVMALARQHKFQLLTKRTARMRKYMTAADVCDRVGHWQRRLNPGPCALSAYEDVSMDAIWPLTNVWLGVSVEDQPRADERIPDLRATPAAVRFVSFEPALEDVDFCLSQRTNSQGAKRGIVGSDTEGATIDWLICGGESGPRSRPMNPEWARSARDQCHAAGVPFFMKQIGSKSGIAGVTGKGDNPDQWPVDLLIREFPK